MLKLVLFDYISRKTLFLEKLLKKDGLECPYGRNCKFSHDVQRFDANGRLKQNLRGGNESSKNTQDDDANTEWQTPPVGLKSKKHGTGCLSTQPIATANPYNPWDDEEDKRIQQVMQIEREGATKDGIVGLWPFCGAFGFKFSNAVQIWRT